MKKKAILKQEKLSETVVYQYLETTGKRTDEMLVASERCYPGVFINKKFYYGITAGNRFMPGIIWCNYFIPGLITKEEFIPGMVVDNVFKPGIINAGIFTPGIIYNSAFIPGVVKDKRFIPGSHTTDQMFAPGRIWNRQFESGIVENSIFSRANRAKLLQEEVSSLPREKYGMTKLRRFDPIGGVPIKGMILGEFDDEPWYLSCGLLTDDGAVFGGVPIFYDQQNLPRREPGVEIDELLDKLGISKYDVDFGKKGEELLKNVEDWLGSMLGTSNPFKPTGSGPSIGEALDALGQGYCDLMDSLNENYNNYWQQRLKNNAGGWIRGDWQVGLAFAVGAVGCGIGAVVGKTVGSASLGLGIGVLVGGTIGYAIDKKIEKGKLQGEISADPDKTEWKPPNKTQEPAEDGLGGSNNIIFGRGLVGPASLYPEIKGPRDRKIYEWKNTECGKVLVVDREALRMAVISASKGTNLGLNVLTGQTTWVHLNPPTAKEIQNHAVCEMLKKIITDPIWHPDANVNLGQ